MALSINGCFVVVAVPLIEGAIVCLFLALKSGIADNICFGSLSKKDSLRTADVCQYLFELSELKIAPSGRRKIQLQILASKPNSYIALYYLVSCKSIPKSSFHFYEVK